MSAITSYKHNIPVLSKVIRWISDNRSNIENGRKEKGKDKQDCEIALDHVMQAWF